MADYSDPKRGTAFRFTLSLYARSNNQIKTAPTLAAGDVKVSKDNGATANITTLPVETPASSGILQVDLSATEMTADLVTVIFRDAAGAEWNDVAVHIAPGVRQMADLAFPNTSGRGMDVDASGGVEVGSFQTGAITAAAFTAGAIDAAALAADAGTEIGTAVWATTTRALTILDEDSTTLDLDATIRAAVGLASANLDTQLTAIDDFLDTEIAAIKAKTDNLPAAPAATGDIPSAATIADAVWDEDATAHQTQGTFGQAIGDPAADADSIWALVNTNLDATVSSRLASASYTSPLSSAGTRGALGMASANLDTQLSGINTLVLDVPTNAELSAALATADDATLAAIAALNNLSAAQVNAEVVDALATDTYAEPGQGTPGATISLATKINYLYAALRNKSTVTATEHKIFADDGTTVIVKRTLSDDATTFSSTELATGA